MNDDGTVVVEDVETGFVDEEWGMIYVTDIKTYGVADMPDGRSSSQADGQGFCQEQVHAEERQCQESCCQKDIHHDRQQRACEVMIVCNHNEITFSCKYILI